jgi:hypothetical protein
MAALNKCLAYGSKSSDGGKATNQQTYRALSLFIRARAHARASLSQWSQTMKTKLVFAVIGLALAMASSANAQQVNVAFATMLNETGCESKYNDDKKAFLFQRDYLNREMTIVGEFKNADKGNIYVKVLPSTLTFDVIVRLRNPQDAFDLERGQRVIVKFQVSSHGGCILSYQGTNGTLLQQQAGR